MIGRPGVAAQMFTALANAGINLQMISTSEVKVSCVIDAADCDAAIKTLCQTFSIQQSERAEPPSPIPGEPVVRGVALDLQQAQLAIRQVPDRPGMAAQIFTLLAAHNISVDMIIQSQRCRVVKGEMTRDIAFTVARMDAEGARQVLEDARWSPTDHGSTALGEVVVDAAIAKVSIVGAGMVNYPGVAAQMFTALHNAGINIQMIATSEIKVSCVVAETVGVQALQVIHAAFELAGTQAVVVPA
jgi:aspartate kinase